MSILVRTLLGLVLVATSPAGASAVPAFWASWLDGGSPASGLALGHITVGSDSVGVAFSGAYAFSHASGDTDWWSPHETYLGSLLDNTPPTTTFMGLSDGGLATITFSEPVEDPLLALLSWNGNVVDFGVPIEFLSFGCGFFGCGTPILNPSGTGFTGSGEVNGLIRVPGTFTAISFTHTSEFFHGLTVGLLGLPEQAPPPPAVPGPASLLLLALGLAGVAAARRRRQR